MPVCAAVFLMKHGLSEALLTQYSAYFLMPPLVLFWIFFFVLVMTQIVAFRKGLTPYLKWCCVFSMAFGMLVYFLAALLGNLLPVPFIILFARRGFAWVRAHIPRLGRWVDRIERKAWSKSDKVVRYQAWGLLLFVAVPLPGTGAWTGTLAASLLDMDFKSRRCSICGSSSPCPPSPPACSLRASSFHFSPTELLRCYENSSFFRLPWQ